MAQLILVRHGQSTWNALDKWTGATDVGLSKRGEEEAHELANLLRDKKIDICFTSSQQRAIKTWEIIRQELGLDDIHTIPDKALNERDYGDLTGLRRRDVEAKYGHQQFMKWRRGWDVEVPGGENLKDVYARAVPYYKQQILPYLVDGKNVIIVAHGNSLRALLKYLENISDNEISKIEMPFSEIMFYEIDKAGHVKSKQVRSRPL